MLSQASHSVAGESLLAALDAVVTAVVRDPPRAAPRVKQLTSSPLRTNHKRASPAKLSTAPPRNLEDAGDVRPGRGQCRPRRHDWQLLRRCGGPLLSRRPLICHVVLLLHSGR